MVNFFHFASHVMETQFYVPHICWVMFGVKYWQSQEAQTLVKNLTGESNVPFHLAVSANLWLSQLTALVVLVSLSQYAVAKAIEEARYSN
jgi:hypothetical protein